MKSRREWRRASIAALLTVGLVHGRAFAFIESTETDGELPANISGVWLLVSHLEFAKPTPTPDAAASPAPAPTPARRAEGETPDVRYFNVINVVKIVHYQKDEAEQR